MFIENDKDRKFAVRQEDSIKKNWLAHTNPVLSKHETSYKIMTKLSFS